MKSIRLGGEAVVFGNGALEHLKTLNYKRTFVVTGGSSMERFGVLQKVKEYLEESGGQVLIYSGIGKNPVRREVFEGLEAMKEFRPDLVLAVGGGSAMDAAKAMLLFYDFPECTFETVKRWTSEGKIPQNRKTAKTGLICAPSTSGTGSEVTQVSVITDEERDFKDVIMTGYLLPDLAILDPSLPMTMPASVAAETGMDALTHAVEAYINHNLDDYTGALCEGAIKGMMEWLPISCKEATELARGKVHNCQCMAGIAFTNVGLGMVHGISHAWGGIYNLAHGLTNAIILPYALSYNRREPAVEEKLGELSYLCGCRDIVKEIELLRETLGIPRCFKEAGIGEEEYKKEYSRLLEYSMLGSTRVNPVKIPKVDMEKMLEAIYYGKPIDF